MQKFLLFISLSLICGSLFCQQSVLERYIQTTGGQVTDTLDNGTIITLELSTDDVEQENNEVDSYFDDDLDAGWEGAPEDQNLLTLGLRFVNLTIPQGAQIDSAFVVFHAHEGKSAEDVAQLTIVGEATDNAITFDEENFNDDYLLTDRPQTDAAVEWTVAEDWTIWQPYKTTNIATVVQEIVNRPGWESGNAMAFIFLPENQGPSIFENAREFTSFENIADPDDVDPQGNPGDGANHPERRPYIQIFYQGAVSVSEMESPLFQLYPNPSTSQLINIELVSVAPAHINIINPSGQIIRNFETKGSRVQLNLRDLSEGVYIIQVVQESKIDFKRLFIK